MFADHRRRGSGACTFVQSTRIDDHRSQRRAPGQRAEVLASRPRRLSVQCILDPARHREQAGVALWETQHLEPQR